MEMCLMEMVVLRFAMFKQAGTALEGPLRPVISAGSLAGRGSMLVELNVTMVSW